MTLGRTMVGCLALLGGIALAASASNPAAAQFACPPGYYFVPGYGCELPNSSYALPEYDYDAPPVVPFSFYDGGWNNWRGDGVGYRGRGDFGHAVGGHSGGVVRR
jgi:hypothetical protein